jgi:hypothetical protein
MFNVLVLAGLVIEVEDYYLFGLDKLIMSSIFSKLKENSRNKYSMITLLKEIISHIFSIIIINIIIINIMVAKSIKYYYLMSTLVIGVVNSMFNFLITKIYLVGMCLIVINDINFG